MHKVLTMILAGGTGDRLSVLSAHRAKPAVPFGGKYRIIDFALSNCTNSGIYQVAALTQYNPRSLVEHIGIGRAWNLDRGFPRGIALLQPYRTRAGQIWYKGTADAVYQNLHFIEEKPIDEVLILAGDHVYTMHYDHMIDSHRRRHADVTIAVTEVPQEQTSRFGIITLDHKECAIGFQEKPPESESNLASMGIYVFNKDVLIECLEEDAERADSTHDFGSDILPHMLKKYNVFGYKFHGYWQDVGTIESYWQANMDLIADLPQLNLYDPGSMVYTVSLNAPPAKVGQRAKILKSLIGLGSIINGRVENSVISPRVYVEEGAMVIDSIIFSDTIVGRDAIIDRCIIDKQVWVGPRCHIGYGDDYTPNQEEPQNINAGITVVGRGARIPPETKIGRNCKIDYQVEISDFTSEFIPSGASVERKVRKRKQRV